VSDPSAPRIRLSPGARSALIVGGLFSAFLLFALFGVLREAQRIRRERDQTKALNSQTAGGEMVWIPAGKMTMGAVDGAPDEQPLHDVKVRGFWMDKTEVTNEQFARFVKETGFVTLAERKAEGSETPFGALVFTPPPGTGATDGVRAFWKQVPRANWRHPEGPDSDLAGREKFPVVHVCWEDAAAFASWAGKRLPSEAEWEYAARGGAVHLPYVWGRELTPGGHWFGNVWQGRFPVENKAEDGFAGLAPVGSFRTNDYGLADMAGNVWEWTADWYRADYYVKSPHADPPGPESSLDPDEPSVPKRVARGGSFLSAESNGAGYRPSARMKAAPTFASSELGFRCARSAK
jgi:formylglycine-generating enzyme required for sulfatase activity